ncbi:hypothetical protein J7426_24085 [Tropicibacter sp. R16_0]|uniref:hypothetical protein n=1 Tax=Tropicibacter sp. R16_0 TaxID=2821102 RepID=UPI001ADC207F|nr:hypothetical protein [Tropicibacter sp. R16_0]MBO9453361.1 hypothetical protein [Tropicibacter sp. R16_0]
MLTAHLPSGYVLSRAFDPEISWMVPAALIGAVLPDLVFFTAILLHLCLDTISGGILWAAPFNDHLYSLVTVPPTQSHWIASFILHWTFVLELMIWGMAIYLWRKGQGT